MTTRDKKHELYLAWLANLAAIQAGKIVVSKR